MRTFSILIFLALFNNLQSHCQIYNKWFQFKVITEDNQEKYFPSFYPAEFEISNKEIKYFNPLSGENYFSFSTQNNLSNNSINLFNTFGTFIIKCNIDSVSNNTLILSTPATKIYFYKIIEHNLRTGIVKLQRDLDTINYKITVTPSFERNFESLFFKTFKSENLVDSCSKLINVSFIVRNSGVVDSIKIDSCETEIKNRITLFLISTNGKWSIKKAFKEYPESKISLQLIIMSKPTKELVQKSIFISAERTLFSNGVSYYKKNEIQKAINFFSESIMLHEYRESLSEYELYKESDSYTNENYVEALKNRAAVYYSIGETDNACKDWKTILLKKIGSTNDIEDAKTNINNLCSKK